MQRCWPGKEQPRMDQLGKGPPVPQGSIERHPEWTWRVVVEAYVASSVQIFLPPLLVFPSQGTFYVWLLMGTVAVFRLRVD